MGETISPTMICLMWWLRIEKTSRQAYSLPQKSKCRRAACTRIRPILSRETTCLQDLRAFLCNQSSWSSTSSLRIVQYARTGWRRSRFRDKMGPSSIGCKWNTYRDSLGRIFQVKVTGLCSVADCLGFVRSRKYSKQWTNKLLAIEDVGKTSCWSYDENSKLQSSERSCWKRSSYQESERKESLRWEKVGEFFSGSHVDNFPKETLLVPVMTD